MKQLLLLLLLTVAGCAGASSAGSFGILMNSALYATHSVVTQQVCSCELGHTLYGGEEACWGTPPTYTPQRAPQYSNDNWERPPTYGYAQPIPQLPNDDSEN
jgi:hypothetical protein